ncbi:MAG: Nramp family divalent metal transporter [Saprospiraceae bacterium]
MSKIKQALKSLLPGIFLFGFTVGTGSVTAMAKAGADYGMSLLWAVFLSCLITFFLLNLFGKFTLITKETALASIKKHIHPAVALFFLIALTANVCGSVIGVMGIISDVCFEWSKNMVEGGIAPIYFAGFFVSLVYIIFLQGNTKLFEQILAVVVGIMAICFLINFILLAPPIQVLAKGMIPNIPDTGANKNAFLVTASMVGTTVFSGLFILRTTLVKEMNWTMADLKTQRKDALFSGFLIFMVSAAIMAAAAGSLHVEGITLENVSELITLLEPFAGRIGVAIFVVGLVAAGVSSQFPNVALLPWLLDDYHQRTPNMKRLDYRVFALIISLLALIVPIFNAKPIVIMIASQAFGALLLPITVSCILILGNKSDLMKTHKYTLPINLTLLAILIFSLVMSYMSITGIINILQSL